MTIYSPIVKHYSFEFLWLINVFTTMVQSNRMREKRDSPIEFWFNIDIERSDTHAKPTHKDRERGRRAHTHTYSV